MSENRRARVRRFARALGALATLAVVAGVAHAIGPPSPYGMDALPETPRKGPVPFGIYQILWRGPAFVVELDREIAALGRPRYVTFFRDLIRPYPREICEQILARGAAPVISLELQRWGQGGGDELERIAGGDYDAFFTTYAQDARDSEQTVLLRFGFEMNGDWFSWGGRPDPFVRAWRRVRAIFEAEGAENVLFTWAPNATIGPGGEDGSMERYWPGDESVDVIGLDGYNFGDTYSEWHRWASFEEIFGRALEKIRRSGVTHPVLITEFACTNDDEPARRARWIRDAYSYLNGRPEVIGAIWFNFDKRREGERNWRVDADAASLLAWRETFGRNSLP